MIISSSIMKDVPSALGLTPSLWWANMDGPSLGTTATIYMANVPAGVAPSAAYQMNSASSSTEASGSQAQVPISSIWSNILAPGDSLYINSDGNYNPVIISLPVLEL
jgi:hypothetical protein